jgi:hypothetical protein
MNIFRKNNILIDGLLSDTYLFLQSTYNQTRSLFTVASAWGQILFVLQNLSQLILYFIEDSITELNIDQATRDYSVRSLARISGYDPGRARSAQGEISIKWNLQQSDVGGSAVIINKNWILTAAHIVKNMRNHRIILSNKEYVLDKVICHEKYNDNVFGYYDIALGHIKDGVDLEPYPALYENNDELGKLVTITGLGLTGNFNTGVNISDGKKRAGSNYVEKIERGTLVCNASKPHQKITELEYLICSGDSGGGLFIDGKLAGINSSVLGYDDKPDSTYGDESCHTRISMYIPWIKNIIKK